MGNDDLIWMLAFVIFLHLLFWALTRPHRPTTVWPSWCSTPFQLIVTKLRLGEIIVWCYVCEMNVSIHYCYGNRPHGQDGDSVDLYHGEFLPLIPILPNRGWKNTLILISKWSLAFIIVSRYQEYEQDGGSMIKVYIPPSNLCSYSPVAFPKTLVLLVLDYILGLWR